MPHKYTKEQIDFLTKHYKGRGNAELTDMFNKHFGLKLKISQIKGFKKNRGLSSGLDGRFEKGQIPWNKGMKGLQVGGEETQFKKGNIPHNYKPVGSERVNADGYVDIKIADPNKWRGKHIVIWEKHNGPVPKNHAIIFADGNRRNFNIDNLILVTRHQLLILNKKNLLQDDADLTRTAVIVAKLYQKISERKKKRSEI